MLVPEEKHIQVGLHSLFALDMGRWKERNRNYTETGNNTLKNNYRNMFFPMFSYVFSGVPWAQFRNVVTRLGLEEPGGPTTADLMARTRSWVVSLEICEICWSLLSLQFSDRGNLEISWNIQVYYFLDFQIGLCKVSSMPGFSYLNWRYLPYIRPI